MLSVRQTEIKDSPHHQETCGLMGWGTGVQHFAYITVSAGVSTVPGRGLLLYRNSGRGRGELLLRSGESGGRK